MPSIWEHIHVGRTTDEEFSHRNLQDGLFQIASQTCSILVQVNNTNNISYGNNTTNIQYNNLNTGESCSTGQSSSRDIIEKEQKIILIPPSVSINKTNIKKEFKSNNTRHESARNLLSSYKHRLSTVLESNNPNSDDDFELWDHSQMLRSDFDNTNYKWNHGAWCKPSCIPITVILTLIVLVVILPLLEHANDKNLHTRSNGSNYICTDICNLQIVESIPEDLNYPKGSPQFMSTFDAWKLLIQSANKSIDIASFYWTLRGSDIFNHTSSWEGEKIFQQLLQSGTEKGIKIRIAQSAPTQDQPNMDTEFLIKRKAAEVRSVNFPKLLGGGVLHTKLWIIDDKSFYIGSANMDWRSLTQVKELGVIVQNCTCLAKDLSKIFAVYWLMGRNNSHIPSHWPDEYSTKFNINTPILVNFTEDYRFKTFFSSSPPLMSPRGRTDDVDAIVKTILNAEKFIYIAVMDYFPLTIYSPRIRYWPDIDDAIRRAAVENKVSIKLLISKWNHSRTSEDYFLRSLVSLTKSFRGVDIQVKRFSVPANENQKQIPFSRVNHNKYMVTDNIAYIGTSNWSGDYFTNTAGVGFVLQDICFDRNKTERTVRSDLAAIFERDWNSPYAFSQSI